MEMATITDLITSVGFPIACVIALSWFIFKIYKKSEEREEELRAELKENREINAEAIKTIALYAERLDLIQRDVNEIKEDIITICDKVS